MTVESIRADVEAGRYLRAWSAAQVLGPLASWTPTPERILAGRLAMALGAPRLGFSLHLKAHRLDPGDAEALYYRARAVLALRGPYAAWRFMRGSDLPDATAACVRQAVAQQTLPAAPTGSGRNVRMSGRFVLH